MQLAFTKMHGTGNDFMVIDGINQDVSLSPEIISRLAHRKTGIGFDQLLLLEASTQPDCDFSYRIFNADGSEVEQCGNGARCITRFVHDKDLSKKHSLNFYMPLSDSRIHCRLLDDGQVTVNMGEPITSPAEIPYRAGAEAQIYLLRLPNGETVDISAVSMGNPHAVVLVNKVDRAPVAELGPLIESHPDFPKRVNAGFMEVQSRSHIRLRVYERGVGETEACGTGACAAVVAGQIRGLLEKTVTVELIGGTLSIEWKGRHSPVLMTGPAMTVYEGKTVL